MTSLLDIAAERRALEALLVESGGEMPPGSALEAAWNANADALVAKVDSYAEFIGDLEALAEKARENAKRLQAKASALDNARQRLLDRAMLALGPDRQELRGEAFRLVRARNPEALTVLDEKALRESCPEAFTEVPASWTLDKAKAKAALKANSKSVRGAVLTRGERIEVKP